MKLILYKIQEFRKGRECISFFVKVKICESWRCPTHVKISKIIRNANGESKKSFSARTAVMARRLL
jgi:hypothetical protein